MGTFQVRRISEPLQGPWNVTYHFAEVDGRFECVGLDVRSFRAEPTVEVDEEGRPMAKLNYRTSLGGLPPAPVTTALIRELPVASLIRVARRDLRDVAISAARQPGQPAAKRRALREVAEEFVERPRRRYDDAHFARVAEVYVTAWKAGKPPTLAVSEEMKASRSAAAKWVAKARKMGLLGETERGRAHPGTSTSSRRERKR